MESDTADAVVVGGGTVGAWCAYFLRRSGLDRVVLVERRTLGEGASSRAAGVVRTQGGTPWAVQLGEWSRQFYRRQQDEIGIDSGFVEQGYILPCFTDADVTAARARMAMQNALGLSVRWLEPGQLDALNPTLAPGRTLGGTYCAEDGFISPPRNVTAYAVALATSSVVLRERTAFTGLLTAGQTPGSSGNGAVTGVQTTAGSISAPIVVLTGGPELAGVCNLAGVVAHAGGVRHQIAVTQPHPYLARERVPMVFDLAAGLYWRPDEGGLLFGMSNPDEPPGTERSVDEPYLAAMRQRLAELVPITAGLGLRRMWAATIDYTPDHLPIIGPALVGGHVVAGVTVASAGGAGMMWGPGVARAAADVALTGRSEVVDTTELGLDRFDEAGNSKLGADPIALPFPKHAPGPGAHASQASAPLSSPDTARAEHLAAGAAETPRRKPNSKGPSTMTDVTPYLNAAASAELEDWGLLEEATGEPMQTYGRYLWEGDGQEVGVWECAPGPSYWKQEDNEFVHILSGRMTVSPDGGEPLEIGAGDTAFFPVGWSGTWDIHDTIRKVFVIF